VEVTYNRDKLSLYEKKARAGQKLAERAQLADDRCRRAGKTLKVASFPQGGERVPSIRVAGKWLERFGFKSGDEVILAANHSQIVIAKKEVLDDGNSLV
jgi:hypothetical protein